MRVFDSLPKGPAEAFDAILSRVVEWMATETSHGCLFHAAVAADPKSEPLRALLERHKADVAIRAAKACGLRETDVELLLIIEGLTQTWTIHGNVAVDAAKRLGQALRIPDSINS